MSQFPCKTLLVRRFQETGAEHAVHLYCCTDYFSRQLLELVNIHWRLSSAPSLRLCASAVKK